MIHVHRFPTSALLAVMLHACGPGNDQPAAEQGAGRTPVTVTHVVNGPIERSVLLNATSRFLRTNAVRSTVSGRIERNFSALGDPVQAGHPLFLVRTKEAEALGTMAARDSTFRIGGAIIIKAPASGIITQLDKQQNDYVGEGDQLALVADAGSSVFILDVPYERTGSAQIGATCTIVLPDSSTVKGIITTRLSMMDGASQTQGFVIKPQGTRMFPEGLIGTVRLTVDRHAHGQILPASALLGNEEMTRFWVMRLLNDSTALKVPVVRGIATHDSVEVIEPRFAPGDRIVATGGYGLPDSAHVVLPHRLDR